MKSVNYLSILIVLFSVIFSGKAQELPPVEVYFPEDYGAESQNWAINQSLNGSIYVANNKGLLEFNGARWSVHPTPNKTIMRSVRVFESKIYTGFYMDFGYWEKNKLGDLLYTSLVKKNNITLEEDEQFWNILQLDEWLLFQSLQRIYLFNTKSNEYKVISSDVKITKMFKVRNDIFFQQLGKGIFKIEKGKSTLISDHTTLKNQVIIDVYYENGELLVLTEREGLLTIKGNEVNSWKNTKELLRGVTAYSAIRLKDNGFAIGSISNGIFLLDKEGNLVYNLTQKKGLTNNTVLSLFEDEDENIWLGLDNGINTINMNSPLRIFREQEGKIGTVYASIIYEDNLYLGTNQGLFVKKYPSEDTFEFIENTEGQVWCLTNIKGTLFCGHDSGTLIIKKRQIENKFNIQGTWNIREIDENTLLQGNYSGLYILKLVNGKWELRNKIEGFDNSSKSFEFYDDRIFVNHEYKGVFKLKTDSDYIKVTEVERDTTIENGLHSDLVKYHQKILYSFKNGIYSYSKDNFFVRDSVLSKLFTDEEYISGRLVYDKKNDLLWSFSKRNISYVKTNEINQEEIIRKIPISESLRKGAIGYENILPIGNEKFIKGINNGYLLLDIGENSEIKKEYKITIDYIYKSGINVSKEKIVIEDEGRFPSKENTLEFYYSMPYFSKINTPEYQYKLEGYSTSWSEWSTDSEVLFENLPFGSYTFQVRARIGNKKSENVASYTFEIDRPWYLSNLLISIYVLILAVFSFFMDRVYKRYYRKQREKLLERQEKEFRLKTLANEKELMKLKNEQLKVDVENKNRELATSTMSIIKKNELLSSIKKELTGATEKDIKKVIGIIDKNLNNTDDWQMFEEAFNNADKDFIKKVKTLHSELTPNDLRLCAYLRLNLSSKEIAPLLNISHRSVEVKRYRLRKKMDLEHDVNLTEYILNI